MDKKKFEEFIKDKLQYSPKLEASVAIPQIKPCQICNDLVTDQKIVCHYHSKTSAYKEHFKHRCSVCKLVLYDGSKRNGKWNDEYLKQRTKPPCSTVDKS